MKYLFKISLILGPGIIGCSGDKPFSKIEATNQEAIYNVLFIDNYRLMTLDFLSTAIPDTQNYVANPDTLRPLIWHDVQYSHEDLQITILDQPVASPVGPVYQSNISYAVTDTGQFRMMRYNTIADSLERYIVKFTLLMTRTATCQQWGASGQSRRGWILTSISGGRYFSGQNPNFLSGLHYSSLTHHDTTFVYGSHDPAALLSFQAGEQVTLRYHYVDSLDKAFIYLPVNDYGYQLALPQQDSLGGYSLEFSMPSRKIYGQLVFLVVYVGRFDDHYRASGYSCNYRIR
jgi:hypothetical protein